MLDFKQATISHKLLVGNGKDIKIHQATISLATKKKNGKLQPDWIAG
jgi:hypothetical protein